MPSLVKFGYRRLVPGNVFGRSGPAHIPTDTVIRLNSACHEILATAEISKKMLVLDLTTLPLSSAAFTGFVREQVAVLLARRQMSGGQALTASAPSEAPSLPAEAAVWLCQPQGGRPLEGAATHTKWGSVGAQRTTLR